MAKQICAGEGDGSLPVVKQGLERRFNQKREESMLARPGKLRRRKEDQLIR